MHLTVLLFLTGTVFAYPLKPVQESQLVPRELPQPHCFHPVGNEYPLNLRGRTYMVTCARRLDAVGWLPQPSTDFQDYKKFWLVSRHEPPECVVPVNIHTDVLGYCFVLPSLRSAANQPHPVAPQNFRPPLGHPLPQAGPAHSHFPGMNSAAPAPTPPRPPFPPPQHPPLNLSPQAGHPSHGQTSPPPRKDTHPKEFPTTISNYADWGFPPH